MKFRAVALLALLASPSLAQAQEDRPMTIERQAVVMRDALEVCRLPLDDRATHAQLNGYSYQEAFLLGSACRLIDAVRREATGEGPAADPARGSEDGGGQPLRRSR